MDEYIKIRSRIKDGFYSHNLSKEHKLMIEYI